MSKQLEGFDYREQRIVHRTRAEWRAALLDVVKRGGYRRCEHGETFAHGADGRVVFEVYAYIPAQGEQT